MAIDMATTARRPRRPPRSGTRSVPCGEALALVAERLAEIVHRHGGEAVLPWWSAGTQGLVRSTESLALEPRRWQDRHRGLRLGVP